MPLSSQQVAVTTKPLGAHDDERAVPRNRPRTDNHRPPERAYEFAAARGMVMRLFADAGWDAPNLGTDDWNPLGHVIAPGSRVLVKPNWVFHRNKSGHDLDVLITNAAVLRSVLAFTLKADPARVVVGDAPIQGCDMDRLMSEAGIHDLQRHFGQRVVWKDFRRSVLKDAEGVSYRITDVRPASEYVLFDMGSDSLLEPIASDADRFRVTMYNPDLMRATHGVGRHQYLIAADAIEADVVINLPKLKTHMKAGLTGALKNLVGINGNKDYLPHHRKGGTETGGDCYPGGNRLKLLAENLADASNRSSGRGAYFLRRAQGLTQRLAKSLGADGNFEGSWYGNDTVWRMSLDLNRVLKYGRLDGSLADAPQRAVISITDGILAGEGNGPLSPTPYPLGVLTLAVNSAAADLVHSHLMGLDWRKLPIVRESFGGFRYPIAAFEASEVEVVFEGMNHAQPWSWWRGDPCLPPSGWRGHCEARTAADG